MILKLYFHTNEEGHVWLNAKNSLILLTQPLDGHIDSKDPHELWHSKATQKGVYSSVTPPHTGGAVNSTAVTQQLPSHTDPTSPIHQIPEGIDTAEEPLASLIDEYKEGPNILIRAMNSVRSILTTPVRSDNSNSGTDPDGSNTASPQNTKTILKEMLINCWSNLGWKTKVKEGTLKHIYTFSTSILI